MADERTADQLLDDLLIGVTEADTVDDSLIALTGTIKAALVEALKGVTLTPAQRAKFDAVFAAVTAGRDKVAAAVVANTDAA